jgi:hypothetical protein
MQQHGIEPALDAALGRRGPGISAGRDRTTGKIEHMDKALPDGGPSSVSETGSTPTNRATAPCWRSTAWRNSLEVASLIEVAMLARPALPFAQDTTAEAISYD